MGSVNEVTIPRKNICRHGRAWAADHGHVLEEPCRLREKTESGKGYGNEVERRKEEMSFGSSPNKSWSRKPKLQSRHQSKERGQLAKIVRKHGEEEGQFRGTVRTHLGTPN